MVGTSKVLVVDDDPEVLELIAEFLDELSLESRLARDGDEALRIFRTEYPSLVITDLKMSGMDGLKLCGPCLRLRATFACCQKPSSDAPRHGGHRCLDPQVESIPVCNRACLQPREDRGNSRRERLGAAWPPPRTAVSSSGCARVRAAWRSGRFDRAASQDGGAGSIG